MEISNYKLTKTTSKGSCKLTKRTTTKIYDNQNTCTNRILIQYLVEKAAILIEILYYFYYKHGFSVRYVVGRETSSYFSQTHAILHFSY